MIKACIFDFDGVICNTESFFLEYKFKRLNEWGLTITKDELRRRVGTNFRQAFPMMFPEVENPEDYIDQYYREHDQLKMPYEEIFNREIFELLDYCKAQHIVCAIASNSITSRVIHEAQQLKIDGYMSALIGHDLAGYTKPDPRFYEYALETLGVKPEEAIIIEDSTIGIQAAVGAKVFTVAKKDPEFTLNQSQANTSVDTLDQVIAILEQLNTK